MARPRIGSRFRHPLVSTVMLAAALAAPTRAVAQAASPEIAEPLVTVTAGLGNAMGWLGMQGERYLAHGLLSVFGGLGYTPKVDAYDPEGITLAAGVRGYTAGLRHRGFAEASARQVATLSDPEQPRRFYGPCGQLGYQYAARGGLLHRAEPLDEHENRPGQRLGQLHGTEGVLGHERFRQPGPDVSFTLRPGLRAFPSSRKDDTEAPPFVTTSS